MKNSTVRQRILLSFTVIIGITLLMAVNACLVLTDVRKNTEQTKTEALPNIRQVALMRMLWTDNYLQVQEVLSHYREDSFSPAMLGLFHKNENALSRLIETYRKTIERNHIHIFERFLAVNSSYREQSDKFLELYKQKRTQQAEELFYGPITSSWSEGRRLLYQLVELNREAVDRSAGQIVDAVYLAKKKILISFSIAVLIAALCGFWLMRGISLPIRRIVDTLEKMSAGNFQVRLTLDRKDEFGDIEHGLNALADELKLLVSQAQGSAGQVATAIREIVTTTRQQQLTATETATATSEISMTSQEIAATSSVLVKTMNEVAEAAGQATTLAGAGQTGLSCMAEGMRRVMGAADIVNGKLSSLTDKTNMITQVVSAITRIADQANLLSLNAAIEAEKAGEYGRNFAAVATELHRMADQTSDATRDIEQMMEKIQASISASVMSIDRFSGEVREGISAVAQVGEQLSLIIDQVQALAPRIQIVNEGMQAQSIGALQINNALMQLEEITGLTVDSLRQTGLAIQELDRVATGLRDGVVRFKV